MNDAQIFTIAMSVVIPVSLLIYSNSRITDVNNRINEIKESIQKLEKHIDEKMDNYFNRIKLLLELHEAMHHHKEDK